MDNGGAADHPDFEAHFKHSLFKEYLVTAKVKMDTVKDEQRLKTTVVKIRPLEGDQLTRENKALLDAIKAKSDEIARLHANALAAPVRETHRAREVRHSAQHRLTDQMRSDEILLRRLEGSQQRGVIPKSQALRQRAQLAEEEELSKLRNKRLALKHKLLLETIKRLKDKLDQRGVPDSIST
jgi:hypothetical protein